MTKREIEKQLKYFKEYDITNFEIKPDIILGNKIVINRGVYKNSLKVVPADFLEGVTIYANLELGSLESVHKNFLKHTVIKDSLYLDKLIFAPKDFLKYTEIYKYLFVRNLKYAHKDFYEKFKNIIVCEKSCLNILDDTAYNILVYNNLDIINCRHYTTKQKYNV